MFRLWESRKIGDFLELFGVRLDDGFPHQKFERWSRRAQAGVEDGDACQPGGLQLGETLAVLVGPANLAAATAIVNLQHDQLAQQCGSGAMRVLALEPTILGAETLVRQYQRGIIRQEELRAQCVGEAAAHQRASDIAKLGGGDDGGKATVEHNQQDARVQHITEIGGIHQDRRGARASSKTSHAFPW